MPASGARQHRMLVAPRSLPTTDVHGALRAATVPRGWRAAIRAIHHRDGRLHGDGLLLLLLLLQRLPLLLLRLLLVGIRTLQANADGAPTACHAGTRRLRRTRANVATPSPPRPRLLQVGTAPGTTGSRVAGFPNADSCKATWRPTPTHSHWHECPTICANGMPSKATSAAIN